MAVQFIDQSRVAEFIQRVDQGFGQPGTIYLIGETTQVVEGWRRFTDEIEICSVVNTEDRTEFNRLVREVTLAMGLRLTDEFPGEVVPLPIGHEARTRQLTDSSWTEGLTLVVSHFDPYSVSFRFIARGSESDYHMVLRFLENGWIHWEEMTERLEHLLPAFSFETIQQDPAEFRRRYQGLSQMWVAKKNKTGERSLIG